MTRKCGIHLTGKEQIKWPFSRGKMTFKMAVFLLRETHIEQWYFQFVFFFTQFVTTVDRPGKCWVTFWNSIFFPLATVVSDFPCYFLTLLMKSASLKAFDLMKVRHTRLVRDNVSCMESRNILLQDGLFLSTYKLPSTQVWFWLAFAIWSEQSLAIKYPLRPVIFYASLEFSIFSLCTATMSSIELSPYPFLHGFRFTPLFSENEHSCDGCNSARWQWVADDPR